MLDGLDLGAVIGAISLIVVAIIERRTRREDNRWEQNKEEHEALVGRMEDIGSSLGRSLDRVESNLTDHIDSLSRKVERLDGTVVSHLEDHARGEFVNP